MLTKLHLASFADLVLPLLVVADDASEIVIDLIVVVQESVSSTLRVRHDLALLHETLRDAFLVSTLVCDQALVLRRYLLDVGFESHLLSELCRQLHLVVLEVRTVMLDIVYLALSVLYMPRHVRIFQLLPISRDAQTLELLLKQSILVGSKLGSLLRLDDHGAKLLQLLCQMSSNYLLLLAHFSLEVGHAAFVTHVLLDDGSLLRVKASS